jgi:intracellular multiplication protein IcmP
MGQQQSQGQSGDSSLTPIWVTLLLFITVFFIWKTAHRYIVMAVFSLNLLQAHLINFFVHSPQLAEDIYLMQTLNPDSVDWAQLHEIMQHVGEYIRYPILMVLALLAIILYRSDVTLRYRRAHNMKTLRMQEQMNWPAIMPIVKHDLANVDINKGPWAMALTPMEFAKKHNLLKKNDVLMDNPVPGQESTAGIRRGDAKRVFTLQLGPIWDGFDRCPPHAQALAAVFMARMNRDKAAAFKILRALDKSTSDGTPDYSVGLSILKKYQNDEKVQTVVSKHAYLLTAMASLLKASRDDGVMPSADFLWLKTIDRRLWYMLNCIGRQTPFVEVSGPFAHWLAERASGRPLLAPMIDESITALEVAIKEIKLSPQELQELLP